MTALLHEFRATYAFMERNGLQEIEGIHYPTGIMAGNRQLPSARGSHRQEDRSITLVSEVIQG